MSEKAVPDATTAPVAPAPAATPQQLADQIAALGTEGRHEEAGALAARLLALRPAHRRALRALGRAPQPGVDLVAGWRQLAAREPDDLEARRRIAQLELRAGNCEAALEAADIALAIDPADDRASEVRVRALLQLDRLDAAASAWRGLYRRSPEAAAALLSRLVATPGSDPDRDAAMLGAAAREQALDELLMAEHHRLRAVNLATAFASEAVGNEAKAALHFQRLTRLDPDEREYTAGLQRIVAKLTARIAPGAPIDTGSIEAAEALIRITPDNLSARRFHVAAMTRAERWNDAVLGWEALFAVSEGRQIADLLDQIEAAARAGQFGLALERWREAAAMPADAALTARLDQARVLLCWLSEAMFDGALAKGDWEDASRAIGALAEVSDPDTVASRRARLERELARHVGGAGEDVPLALLRVRYRNLPNQLRGATVFGRALMRARLDEEALAVWSGLTAAFESEIEPWLQLARCARRLRDHSRCGDAARRVLSLDPAHAEAASMLIEAETAAVKSASSKDASPRPS